MLAHAYDKFTTDATCNSKGEVVVKCTVEACGHVADKVVLPALGHNLVRDYEAEALAENQPTCTKTGKYVYKCSRNCGMEPEVIERPALGHDYSKTADVIKEATCTTDGVKRYNCTRGCGDYIETEIAKSGHNITTTTTVPPTCTDKGYTVKTCGTCNKSYIENNSFTPANGHTWNDGVESPEATCTTAGTMTYTCTVPGCGATKTEVVSAKTHNYEAGILVAPTCTTSGYTPYTCSNCGDTYNKYDETKPATGHSFTDTETIIIKATCTADGSKTVKCKNCNETTTVVIPKTGHDYKPGTSVDATCTSSGYTPYTCGNCNDTYNKYDNNAKTHSFTSWDYDYTGETTVTATCKCDNCNEKISVTVNKRNVQSIIVNSQPTCQNEGSATVTYTDGKTDTVTIPKNDNAHNYVSTYTAPTCSATGSILVKCSICGNEIENETLDKLPHNYDDGHITTEPTCTTDGVKTFTCNSCGATRTETVPKTGHTLSTVYNMESCTEKGSVVTSCSKCDYESSKTIAQREHSYTKLQEGGTVATCEADGIAIYKCENCDATTEVTLAKLGHDMKSTTVAGNCEKPSYLSWECQRDGCTHAYITRLSLAGGHTPELVEGEKTFAATCETDGNEYYKCRDCEYDYNVVIPKLGHNYQLQSTAASTCYSSGYEVYKCQNGAAHTETATLTYNVITSEALKEHNWSSWQIDVNATETTEGSKYRDCLNAGCSARETDVIPAMGHNMVEDTAKYVAPKCFEAGLNVYKCDVKHNGVSCDYELEVIIPAIGHHNLATVVTEATCTTVGSVVTSCKDCGFVDTAKNVTFAALGHDFSEKLESECVSPSCSQYGKDVYKCSRCDEKHEELIEKLDHTYTEVNTPATCTERAYTTYTCSCGASYTVLGSPAKGHKYENEGAKVVTAPTCKSAGYTTYNCDNCDETHKADFTDVVDHKYEAENAIVTVLPTCTTAGYTVYKCDVCGKTTNGNYVPAKGHKYENADAVVITPATCTTAGYTTYNCDNCDEMHLNDLVPAKGHAWGEWSVIHGENGDTLKRVCGNDGAHFEEVTAPAGAGHRFDENVFTTTTGTCLIESTKTFKCTVHSDCGVQLTVKTGFEAHTWGEWTIVSGENNDIISRECVLEGCNAQESYNIPANGGHKYEYTPESMVVVDGNCTTPGYITFSCTAHANCGETFTVTTGYGKHHYKTERVEPDCETPGYVRVYCDQCLNSELSNEPIPTKGHNYDANGDGRLDRTDAVYHPGTATEKPYYTYTCQNLDKNGNPCNHSYDEEINELYDVRFFDSEGNQIGETQSVSYGESVTAPAAPEKAPDGSYHYIFASWDRDYTNITSDLDIYPTYEKEAHYGGKANCAEKARCQFCAISYGSFDSSKHNMVRTSVPATCTADGAITNACTRCSYKVVTAVKATGHNFGEWEVIEKGNCLNERVEMRRCLNGNCHEFEEKRTTADHVFIIVEGKPATCMNDGYTDYKICTVCKIETGSKVIPKIDHRDINGDGKCDYCGSGQAKPTCNCMCHSTGFMKFIYAIARFFWKLTGSNKSCSCGAVHY